jgi:hypothetical protein
MSEIGRGDKGVRTLKNERQPHAYGCGIACEPRRRCLSRREDRCVTHITAAALDWRESWIV